MADTISLVIKWAGKEIPLDDICVTSTVGDLKRVIEEKTSVLPGRQKLLNLKYKGKPATDDLTLCSLTLKTGTKIMMMGSSEQAIKDAIEVPEGVGDEVVNDFEEECAKRIEIEHREEYLAKVANRISNLEINIRNTPREGKKLLVLDIDYTLFDHRSTAQTGAELMRPYLHEFLTSAYEDYDIVIWSATSMKWIEEKMKVLGCDKNPNYKLAFYLDCSAMISINSSKYGVIEVKPLGVIWGKFPNYKKETTIMFDDLRRNFLMNPGNGLRIRPFKNSYILRNTDNELLKLSVYLKLIAQLPSFEGLDHKHWESYVRSKNTSADVDEKS